MRATPAQTWGKGVRAFGSAPLWSTEPLLARDKGAPHGAANSMMVSPVRSRATPAQTWGKGVRTFGSAPRLASVKGDLASVKGDHGLRPRACAASGLRPSARAFSLSGLRPRARAGSGLRPCARAFSLSGSAPRLASVNRDLKPSSFFSLRDSIMNISRE